MYRRPTKPAPPNRSYYLRSLDEQKNKPPQVGLSKVINQSGIAHCGWNVNGTVLNTRSNDAVVFAKSQVVDWYVVAEEEHKKALKRKKDLEESDEEYSDDDYDRRDCMGPIEMPGSPTPPKFNAAVREAVNKYIEALPKNWSVLIPAIKCDFTIPPKDYNCPLGERSDKWKNHFSWRTKIRS